MPSSAVKQKKLGLETDDLAIGNDDPKAAPSGGGLSGLVASASKLLSGFGLPGLGGKKAPEKKASDDETNAEDGAENSDGEGDASEDEPATAEEALSSPKKLDISSLLNNAQDLISPHLKSLGLDVGAAGGAARGGSNPLAGLLGSFGSLFGGGAKASTREPSTTEESLE